MRDRYADLGAAYRESISRDPRVNPRPSTNVVPPTPSLDDLDMDTSEVLPSGVCVEQRPDIPLFGFHVDGDRRYE